MDFLLDQAVASLSRGWLFLTALASSSTLFAEASSSADPRALMVRTVQRFAPATLERYFAECKHWTSRSAAAVDPSAPPAGLLPDWLQARSSPQSLATGPVRALNWFAKHAGLPHLLTSLQVRSFLSATNPSERRESPAFTSLFCGLA